MGSPSDLRVPDRSGHSSTSQRSLRARHPPITKPLCVKWFVLGRVGSGRCRVRLGGVGLVSGPGSDLSEEPAFQDVEPVTLDSQSFLVVLPGPPVSDAACSLCVSDEVPVDDVRDAPFERADGFFAGLSLAAFAVVIDTPFGVVA